MALAYNELLFAPTVRTMAEVNREGSADLQELYSRLWG